MFPCTDIRLVGGSNTGEGRVEVYYYGEWSTIFNDGYWDNTDAGVVCRQLGLGLSGTAARNAEFGEGGGTIKLGCLVSCYGTERDIKSCPANPYCINDCRHSKDAGVRCVYVSI